MACAPEVVGAGLRLVGEHDVAVGVGWIRCQWHPDGRREAKGLVQGVVVGRSAQIGQQYIFTA